MFSELCEFERKTLRYLTILVKEMFERRPPIFDMNEVAKEQQPLAKFHDNQSSLPKK